MALAIEQRRKQAGLTQSSLASAVGVNQSSVCQWEQGLTTPKSELLPSIARACHCSIDDLFSSESEREDKEHE